MCLILLALHAVPKRPWLLLGNRDEYHGRPSAPAAHWSDAPNVVGGRDLEAGGSWLAVTREGRFAAVTNVRAGPPRRGMRSRGALVSDFVRGGDSASDYAQRIAAIRDEFGPFNLIVGDREGAWGSSTLSETAWRFADGVHVLSNGPPSPQWPKARHLDEVFARALRANADDAALLDLLGDTSQPDEAMLPDTGVGIELEKFLAPVFIRGNEYGTRASTLAYAGDDGAVTLRERRFGPRGFEEGETSVVA